MKPIPFTAADLIRELDADHPARPPRIDDSNRKIWVDVGRRELIDALLQRLKKTEEKGNILKETPRVQR